MGFIELHERLRLPFSVVPMLILNLLDVGLEPLEKHLTPRTFVEYGEQHYPDKDGEENDGDAKILEREVLIQPNERVKKGAIENFVK